MKHKKKVALITGIAGQDGSYLSELLLSLDYKVYGIIRRKSIVEHQADRIEDIGFRNQIELLHGDMTDTSSLERYNLSVMGLKKRKQMKNWQGQLFKRL